MLRSPRPRWSLAATVLLAACRGDPVTAPPATTLAEGAPAAAHGPVAVPEVLDLGRPAEGGPYFGLRGAAINERGQVAVFSVAGVASTGDQAPVPLLWEAGAIRPLVPATGRPRPAAFVTALTGSGVAVGFVQPGGGAGAPPGPPRAALFPGGAPALLPDGPGVVTSSTARGANEAGDVVGSRVVRLPGDNFATDRATLWRRGTGEVVDLGALAARGFSQAYAVNNRGQAVGIGSVPGDRNPRPVFFGDGRVIALELPPGYTSGFAFAVNARGQAAGVISRPAGGSQAAFWDQGGGWSSSACRRARSPASRAGSTTRATWSGASGWAGGPGGAPSSFLAALWRGGALTVLPPAPRPPSLLVGDEASAINNRGQVVGQSSGGGDIGQRAVRWTVSPAAPIPHDPTGPNRAPAVLALRPDPAAGPYRLAANACGGRFTVCVRFTVADPDGDADAPFRVVIDWGDGTPWTPNELTRSGVPALAPHSYRTPGTYTVRVTATDRRGRASTATLTLTVVP